MAGFASLRVLDIIPGTSVDGPGLRTTIYFAGCPHHCEGCHNPQSWNPEGGRVMTADEILDVVEDNGFNVTFSGGDPLLQIDALLPLAAAIRRRGYNIWLYTGYTFEQIAASPRLRPVLDAVDVVVDGPFILSLRDTGLRFRGSSNQRVLYCPSGHPWDED